MLVDRILETLLSLLNVYLVAGGVYSWVCVCDHEPSLPSNGAIEEVQHNIKLVKDREVNKC